MVWKIESGFHEAGVQPRKLLLGIKKGGQVVHALGGVVVAGVGNESQFVGARISFSAFFVFTQTQISGADGTAQAGLDQGSVGEFSACNGPRLIEDIADLHVRPGGERVGGLDHVAEELGGRLGLITGDESIITLASGDSGLPHDRGDARDDGHEDDSGERTGDGVAAHELAGAVSERVAPGYDGQAAGDSGAISEASCSAEE